MELVELHMVGSVLFRGRKRVGGARPPGRATGPLGVVVQSSMLPVATASSSRYRAGLDRMMVTVSGPSVALLQVCVGRTYVY